MTNLLPRIKRTTLHGLQALRQHLASCTRPTTAAVAIGMAADLTRSTSELIAENALLRRQLIILQRRRKHPALLRWDRAMLVLLASRVTAWRQALPLPGWRRQAVARCCARPIVLPA